MQGIPGIGAWSDATHLGINLPLLNCLMFLALVIDIEDYLFILLFSDDYILCACCRKGERTQGLSWHIFINIAEKLSRSYRVRRETLYLRGLRRKMPLGSTPKAIVLQVLLAELLNWQ